MEPRWQYQFRVIMLGDSTVGKSSLLRRYTEGIFLDAVNQTVGVDFYVQFVELEPGLRVKLQFWDTAGQERFRWVRGVGRGGGDGCPTPDLGWGVVDAKHREVLDVGVLSVVPLSEEPLCQKLKPRERSPWDCLVSSCSSSKGGTGLPQEPPWHTSCRGAGEQMGAHCVLGKTSSAAQLLGAFTPHCGAVSSSQAAPRDRKAWETWLQGMGKWQIWVCRNGRVPGLLQQRRESTGNMAAGAEQFQEHDSRDAGALGTWLQTQGHLGAVAAGHR